MSLLGTQVYANPTTPLWVSATGDTINGNLTVAGTTTLEGPVVVPNGINGIELQDTAGTSTGLIVAVDATGTDGSIETDGVIYLGRSGAGNTANSFFDPSAPTTNGDVLSIGGRIDFLGLSTPASGTGPCIGTGQIAIGASSVVVPTTEVTLNSFIYLTRIGPASAGPAKGQAQSFVTYDPTNIVANTSFRVDLVDANGVTINAANTVATFNWFIINSP